VNALISRKNRYLTPKNLFAFFKYTVYLLLTWNLFFWFQEDLAASSVTFRGGVSWRNVVEAFSATIDTMAWLVLVWLFELETWILSDEKLQGSYKWILTALSAVCYAFIVYSFWGYCVKYGMISNTIPFSIADVCDLVGSEWTYVSLLDEYLAIDPATCATMQGQELLRIAETEIIGTQEQLKMATRLAIIDILNAATWLIVVFLMEVEIWLQIREKLTNRLLVTFKYLKGALYSLLFFSAVYWGFEGDFLDFWDAFLWLVAFVFIDLNIFKWHEATEEAQ
jgi:hypothetical protein